MKFILAKKKVMDQIFDEGSGRMVPVTVVEAGPCFVSQIKTGEKEGYTAVQVAFGKRKELNKPLAGHFKKLGANRAVKEFRITPEEASGLAIGDTLTAASFAVGDVVDATGITKGRGFAGVVKRHGFSGSPASHGHKDQLRMPGSIGAGGVQRVFKNLRMGGHMGDAQVTIKGLEVMKVDAEKNELFIKGALPGAINGIVSIKGDGQMTPVKAEQAPKAEPVAEPVATEPIKEEIPTSADDASPSAPDETAKSEEAPVAEEVKV